MIAKFILCPDYKPLYACWKRFGYRKGPIEKPALVEIDVIHDLLTQVDPPELYEVVPTNPELTKYGTPVKLTLENYTLPYEEILSPKKEDDKNPDDDKKDPDDGKEDPETPPSGSGENPTTPTDPDQGEDTPPVQEPEVSPASLEDDNYEIYGEDI